MTISQYFFEAWHASKALNKSYYDRLCYCRDYLCTLREDFLDYYFDGNEMDLFKWMEKELQ